MPAPPPTDLVRLEGFHALKHALRFGAEIVDVEGDADEAARLASELAPDLRLPPMRPAAELVALARRPDVDVAQALARPGPVIYLEHPRRLGNLGAAIRVAAAAGAAAVLTTADPWHPVAIRGAAGLQFALPVAQIAALPPTGRPLIAVDPDGEETSAPRHAVLAFGSERHGLTTELKAQANARLRIPMRPGVSSLNLATAVAAVLYGLS
ncbi:MAG TPA: TrmH family RNA methyltransferase [Solirubrobacter sp.]|nr:TrmH family RNA methyltransferase [Solirubrobacter sp.]